MDRLCLFYFMVGETCDGFVNNYVSIVKCLFGEGILLWVRWMMVFLIDFLLVL